MSHRTTHALIGNMVWVRVKHLLLECCFERAFETGMKIGSAFCPEQEILPRLRRLLGSVELTCGTTSLAARRTRENRRARTMYANAARCVLVQPNHVERFPHARLLPRRRVIFLLTFAPSSRPSPSPPGAEGLR
jgi:hypothetical protein